MDLCIEGGAVNQIKKIPIIFLVACCTKSRNSKPLVCQGCQKEWVFISCVSSHTVTVTMRNDTYQVQSILWNKSTKNTIHKSTKNKKSAKNMNNCATLKQLFRLTIPKIITANNRNMFLRNVNWSISFASAEKRSSLLYHLHTKACRTLLPQPSCIYHKKEQKNKRNKRNQGTRRRNPFAW